jgi:hypothetical protein
MKVSTVTQLKQEAYLIALEADKLPPCVKRVRLRERYIRLVHLAAMLQEMEPVVTYNGIVEPPMDMEDNV